MLYDTGLDGDPFSLAEILARAKLLCLLGIVDNVQLRRKLLQRGFQGAAKAAKQQRHT